MKCGKIRDLLITDYIDGEATKETEQDIKAHLAECRKCAEYHEKLKGVSLPAEGQLMEITPPEAVWEGIEKRIRLADTPKGFSLSKVFAPILDVLARPVVPAMVAVLVLFCVFEGIRPQRDGGFLAASEYLVRQANYLTGLGKGPVKASGDNFGSSIEQVFF
ncbi:MAG: zf-HC2 domain-containing protein [Candidatus Omnitrophica bacterium]|nr:zf-HC2 domain-containing protein [Candidatus Omnitrophota bacterium]